MADGHLNCQNTAPPSSSKYTVLYTATTKRPYIPLTTRSQEPIYLTEIYPADAPAWQVALSIESINNALISPPKPYTLADAEWWIDHVRSSNVNLALNCLRAGGPDENGTAIGSVALAPYDQDTFAFHRSGAPVGEGDRDCNVGYWLHPQFQGLGIMKEAVRALVNWGRREYQVGNAMIKVVETNLASRRVVDGMSEFVRVAKDEWVEWPENKGSGGKKKLLVWVWEK